MIRKFRDWFFCTASGAATHASRSAWIGGNGYLYLDVGAQREKRLLHREIWESVNGGIPPGMCINHINGIKTDNRLCNLEVVSLRENNRHAARIGLTARGEKSGHAVLTEQQAREIASAEGTVRSIAEMYGVSACAVNDIRKGRTWRHLCLPRSPDKPARARKSGTVLTPQKVQEARCRASCGESVREIAKDIGANPSTLHKAVCGYSWAHLPGAVQ